MSVRSDLVDALIRAGIFTTGADVIASAVIAAAGSGSGGGGASAFADLTDAATVDLPSTNASVNAIKTTADAAAAAVALKAPINNPTFTGTVGGITASTVGLGNVNNTSDANKPVSTAQAAAIALKLTMASNLADLPNAATARTNLGLGNVNNTSDANKPVSTAQQTAIDAKVADNLTASTTVAPSKTAVNTALAAKAAGGAPVALPGTSLTISAALHDGRVIDAQSSSATTITLDTGAGLTEGFVVLLTGSGGVTVSGTATLIGDTATLSTANTALAVSPTGVADIYFVAVASAPATTLAELTDIVSYDLATNNVSVAGVKVIADAAAVDSVMTAALAAKQATLVSGTNLKTINGVSLLGGGDLAVSGGASAIASISGTYATGEVLTLVPATGWAGTYQWTNAGVDIPGETNATYTLVLGDEGDVVTCRFTPTSYTPEGGTSAGSGTGRADTFNRADENPLAAPSDGGTAWFSCGLNNNPCCVVSNTARATGSYSESGSALACSSADGTVAADVTIGFESVAGLYARVSDYLTFGAWFTYDTVSAQWTLQKRVGGSFTSLASPVSEVLSSGTYSLSIVLSGDSIICKNGSTTIFSVTSAHNDLVANHGISLTGSNAANQSIDNFTFTP